MPTIRTAIAPLNGWRQGAQSLALANHTFEATPDGQIAHYTDGDLRATIPPEGWDGYAQFYPEVGELAAEMRRNVQAAAVDPARAAADAIAKAMAQGPGSNGAPGASSPPASQP